MGKKGWKEGWGKRGDDSIPLIWVGDHLDHSIKPCKTEFKERGDNSRCYWVPRFHLHFIHSLVPWEPWNFIQP
jgi:hypothetical protein